MGTVQMEGKTCNLPLCGRLSSVDRHNLFYKNSPLVPHGVPIGSESARVQRSPGHVEKADHGTKNGAKVLLWMQVTSRRPIIVIGLS